MSTIALLASLVAGVGPSSAESPQMCTAVDGPPYYAMELVTTRNVPGTGLATGSVDVMVPPASPFSVLLEADGSYVYQLALSIERMRQPSRGRLVAWVTTPDLDQIERLGALDENLRADGTVRWNRFIVVVTLEERDDPSADTWSGPIVFRGMSRSGMMHTMVGHGALQQENCAAYGYGD